MKYGWYRLFLLAVCMLVLQNTYSITKCEEFAALPGNAGLIQHMKLRTQCDLENPCLQLQKHDEYWKNFGKDRDPLRRIMLNAACNGPFDQNFTKAVDIVITEGEKLLKPLKKASLDVIHALSTLIRDKIKSDFYLREHDPYKGTVALVRLGNDPISPAERAVRVARFEIVKAAQEKFLGISLEDDEVLDIAFSLSGGGIRASLYGLGSLVGSQKIGLLDCVMTIDSLSGGTWGLFPWIASNLDVTAYLDTFIAKWEHGYKTPSHEEISYMVNDAILVPFAFKKDVTVTDIYGALLNNVLFSEFGPKRQRVKLSSLAGNPHYPIPVGEAVWAGLSGEERYEELFEFSPYEVGSRWLKSYVPAWGAGRAYHNGESTDFAPEGSIPLGIFGSAYAVRLSSIADMILHDVPEAIKKPLSQLMEGKAGEVHTNFAIMHNFTKGMPLSPIKNEDDIPLSDSGAGDELAIMPLPGTYRGELSHLHPDVLIFFDSGASAPYADLPVLERIAQRMNLALPHLTGKDRGSHFYTIMTRFEDRTPDGLLDLTKPLCLYYPRISDTKLLEDYKDTPNATIYQDVLKNFNIQECLDSGRCGTFSFTWPRVLAQQVATQAEFNVIASQEQIREAMMSVINTKRAKKGKK